jgi:purine-binding chemotaxis protein CheW
VSEKVETKTEVENDEKYLIFSILERQCALPSRFIGEIALFDAVYPLPLMPDYVPGIINRYSVPYALFDIGMLLFKTPGLSKKALVLKDDIDRIAFMIDDVCGIVDVPEEKLFKVERSAESGELAETISASFNWEGGDVFVLDVHRILARAADEAV